jgi:hypothetical protein
VHTAWLRLRLLAYQSWWSTARFGSIISICIENDHQLLHNDGDYDACEQHLGLQVIHP